MNNFSKKTCLKYKTLWHIKMIIILINKIVEKNQKVKNKNNFKKK